MPVTASPTHVQLVAAALRHKVVDPQSDVVAHGHNKKALVVQPVGVLNAIVVVSVVVHRIRVPVVSWTKNPTATSIGSIPTPTT